MDCPWDAALLRQGDQLPPELLQVIQQGDDREYLTVFTQTALESRYTYLLLAHCEDLFAHVCASLREHATLASSIATLGRVVPYAPFLSSYASGLLERERYEFSPDLDSEEDLLYLLGVFRLLRTDHRLFSKLVDSSKLAAKLGRSSQCSTYLILRILQITLHGADHWFEASLKRYLGTDSASRGIDGPWDEKTIDFRFLSLWEQYRHECVLRTIDEIRASLPPDQSSRCRSIPLALLHQSTCTIGDVVLPRLQKSGDPVEPLVKTNTVQRNMKSIARAMKSPQPILLSGLAGSGKTTLVRHVAALSGQLENMVVLHLNEQSDAKLLLGIYTSGDTPGTFIWKPGVLTTAVVEGRWVMIEDLDRAPNEVISTILPLVEMGELFLPARNQTIQAATGFRIFATVRTSINLSGMQTVPLSHMIGIRHWTPVAIEMPTTAEHVIIAEKLFTNIHQMLPQFQAVYDRLLAAQTHMAGTGRSKSSISRTIGVRDFLSWCQRASTLVGNTSSFSTKSRDEIFLEATDCFLGALPDTEARSRLVAIIAEELHIDPQRRDHLLDIREVTVQADKAKLSVGYYHLTRTHQTKVKSTSFSTNPHTARMLERVAAAVCNGDPLLLVGETGVGKTTAVQYLANCLGKKLVPFNLSQQSEAGDLLGGFKPVSTRGLMIPLVDEFNNLFTASFSSAKNQQFLGLLQKQVGRSNWRTVCKLWHQALQMVDQQRSASPSRAVGTPNKKRKIEGQKAIDYARWDSFASQVTEIEQKFADGNDVFAFTFVEGNIVKALRNGDWLLLDEINLASPDTLEAIADLLDSANPSLLLTEAGKIERVRAHTEFRVFAAMNPATDIGKKDLPSGIRSRFSELYVESPDKDTKSLQSIVRAYLSGSTEADTAATSDVSSLYQNIVKLVQENRLVDGAGQKPHFSLRSLTRTLTYAQNIQQMCGLRRALYEGFQMGFLTSLDAESRGVALPLIHRFIFGKRTNLKAEMSRSLQKPTDGHRYAKGHPKSLHWIRQGNFDILEQPDYIITPYVEANLENLVRATSTRKFPVLIQGPTSSGKTSMIEYLAKRTGHKFVRINNHEHTDLQEYLGTYASGADGQLAFQEGILVKALREGHWLVLDELNLAPTDVLEALNRLLDDNRELLIPETQEIVRPHEDFMLFATQNPAGLYGGRKPLSRAFRNRFLELHFDDIPVNELEEILQRRTKRPESWCRFIINVYKELSVLRQEQRLFEQKSFATLRDLFRWALRQSDTKQQLAENGYMLLCERVRKAEERTALKALIEKVMSTTGPRVKIDENHLYEESSSVIRRQEDNPSLSNVVWTKAMQRLYVLVAKAIENNEPVLLVGETGCGKTTVCQLLAEAHKRKLHTVNAHQNTETGDLIGSQRPVRNRSTIETSLRQQLATSPAIQDTSTDDLSTEAMLEAYDGALASLDTEHKQKYSRSAIHVQIQATRTRWKALFEWTDGSLVQAMRSGEFFLLDEISLADDSVLERLNSVLESQRTILLAERGSVDSSVTAADGFQFLATMNPGGDYGKRELSPALRNRFTEIWVPAFVHSNDILQIVRSRMVNQAQSYADTVVTFATWFKLRYDTSASSSVSIRDTLAWVDFINSFAHIDLLAAVIHGAAMVYIDTLGANPAGLMSTTSQSLDAERNVCLRKLGELLRLDASTFYSQPLAAQIDETSFAVGPFRFPRHNANGVTMPSFTFDPPTTRLNAMRILRALQVDKPILLEGSPGVGKTALITAVAGVAGVPLTRINLSDQTDLLDLFGSDAPVEGAETGTFSWRDAPFLRAMKQGEWVLLDEMNLASQPVLEGLNSCLDHRGEVFVPELGQTFQKHQDFRLFAAQNPHHQGGGRKGLPASFVNRFTVVFADSFRCDDLTLICQRMFPSLDSTYIEQAVAFLDKLQDEVVEKRRFGASGGPWEFNLRDIARWLILASSEGLLKSGSPRDFVDILFAQRFRTTTDMVKAISVYDSVYGNTPGGDLFCSTKTTSLQVGLALLSRDVLDSQPQDIFMRSPECAAHVLSVLQSVMLCVQKGWPVILSGPSGVGKTSLISRLAANTGNRLITIAMSAETDALDLIGGFEQHDPQRQLSQALFLLSGQIQAACKHAIAESPEDVLTLLRVYDVIHRGDRNLQELTDAFDGLPDAVKDSLQAVTGLLNAPQIIDKARFEWHNGPLIQAMQQGTWLVLDNANLCSPAVLDRLNSLLEPSGTLLINEHGGEDGQPRIVQPHPDFRIFLTTDPKFGELSRAMRNRAVELFMPFADSTTCVQNLTALCSRSSMARFMDLRTPPVVMSRGDLETAISIGLDHLAIEDQILLPRLQNQIRNGLWSAELREAEVDLLVPTDGLKFGLEAFYREASAHVQTSADLPFVQTFHPLNNQPLVQQSEIYFQQALSLAASYDLELSFRSVVKGLREAQSDRSLIDRLTRFSRNMYQELKVAMPRTKIGLFDSLEQMLQAVQTFMAMPAILTEERDQKKAAVRQHLAFCSVVLSCTRSEMLDQSQLHALAAILRGLFGRKPTTPGTQAIAAMSDRFGQAFFNVIPTSQDKDTYRDLVSLWKAFKSSMPKSMAHLHALLQLENVINRFDIMSLQFTANLSETITVRQNFHIATDLDHGVGSDLASLSESLARALNGMTPEDLTLPPAFPNFATSFEKLCQHYACLSISNPQLQSARHLDLETLAARKTVDTLYSRSGASLQSPPRVLRLLGLSSLRSLTADAQSHLFAEPHADIHVINADILNKIAVSGNVSLERLALLETECTHLGHAFASQTHLLHTNVTSSLDAALRHLLRTVILAVASAGHSVWPQTFIDQTLSVLDGEQGSDVLLDGLEDSTQHWPDAFQGETAGRVLNVVRYLHSISAAGNGFSESAAIAWTNFALLSVGLYVSPNAYDPVQAASMSRAVFEHTKLELGGLLRAVQNFREGWTGQRESLRARSYQEELSALGPGPDVVEICRPEMSQFGSLHSEFQALSRILEPLRQTKSPQVLPLVLDESLWNNIMVIRSRLTEQFRAYADLTIPIIGFIDCLNIARRYACTVNDSHTESSVLVPLTPLLGADLHTWLSDTCYVEVLETCRSPKEYMNWLSIVAARSVAKPINACSSDLRTSTRNVFDRFYEAWKIELSRDQRHAAAQSSLYRYRGDDEIKDEDVTNEEINNLFPTHDTGIEESGPQSAGAQDTQALAPELSSIYGAIHGRGVLQYQTFLTILGRVVNLPPGNSTSAGHGSYTPAIMRQLRDLKAGISSDSEPAKPKNIYKDPNIEQSKVLLGLVNKIKRRFTELQKTFPENSLPRDVLVECETILRMGHMEPLAKFLPVVEQLHDRANEWQKVASSQYSVNDLLEEAISLIVSWRRLELSTWNSLFDREDEQSEQAATSWWFVAYEAIINPTNESEASFGDVEHFSGQLVATLAGFLSHCGLGEFCIRLQMLQDFAVDLASRSGDNSLAPRLRSSVENIIGYFSPFQVAVRERLATRRAELSKEVKDIIQLFAWKTRNIRDMRANAKASHKKLFRIVRKYRRLLSESVAPLLQANYPSTAHRLTPGAETAESSLKGQKNPLGLDLNQRKNPTVPEVAAFFREVKVIAERLGMSSSESQGDLHFSSKIRRFLDHLREESSELRKATPAKLTESNKGLVQHLKTRKRRLLADVLRDTRFMGFQTNLSEDLLAQQKSTPVILAHLGRPLSTHSAFDGLDQADLSFYHVLHLMSPVRQAALKHSEDLTAAEANRCTILLESMLRTAIEDRVILDEHLASVASLQSTLITLARFATCEAPTLSLNSNHTLGQLKSKTKSIITVLQTCIKCIEAQGYLAEKHYHEILADLNCAATDLTTVEHGLDRYDTAIPHISDSTMRELESRCQEINEHARRRVSEAIKRDPELEPILSHLSGWISNEFHSSEPETTHSSGVSVDSWKGKLFSSLQQIQKSGQPVTLGNPRLSNKKAWLVEAKKQTTSRLRHLNVTLVMTILDSALQDLGSLKVDDKTSLAQLQTTCSLTLPALNAFADLATTTVLNSVNLHIAANDMIQYLATSFVQLASQGFCTPAEKAPDDQEQSGEVQTGTGLGDGDGAEDISKDVGNDEDLSELAQDSKPKEEGEEMESEKDAVDMADEDLEGEFDETGGEDKDDEGSNQGDQSGEEVDEEVGNVDQSDPAAKDEKQWDAGADDDQPEKETDKSKGTKSNDISAAEDAEPQTVDEMEGDEQDVEDSTARAEDDSAAPPEIDQADPHVDTEENLDLPEDLAMDGEKMDNADDEDALSDIADNMEEAETEDKNADQIDSADADFDMDQENKSEDAAEDHTAEAEDDRMDSEAENNDQDSDIAMLDRQDEEQQAADGMVSANSGQGLEDQEEKQSSVSAPQETDVEQNANDPASQSGKAQGQSGVEARDSSGKSTADADQQTSNPTKQLGDILKEWYKQHRGIDAAQDTQAGDDAPEGEVGTENVRFQHVSEDLPAETQALGAASAEQSTALDEENAVSVNDEEDPSVPLDDEPPTPQNKDADEDVFDSSKLGQDQGQLSASKAMIGKPTDTHMNDSDDVLSQPRDDEMVGVDDRLSNTHLIEAETSSEMQVEEARRQWADHETRTRNMALILTEQLRLILQPTQATKMRGDFRTGKRLNIKKIIPYIASSYKRDKIWMRRSVPSKRSYQIMLAIDDSESMTERQSKDLAFDTLALVAKSMAMLEVGELCIVGFGEGVNVAHDFSMPFTTDAGAEVLRQFSFAQTKTDVRKLLERSIDIFRAARLRATGSTSDLWQLQLIISDGECEDHPGIRRLVRQAHEERILVVFIVVDAVMREGAGSKQSIMDLPRAEFTKDANGEMQVKMVKYLETFPFRYYLIVRDVLELPGVLAGALRQWFAEVSDASS